MTQSASQLSMQGSRLVRSLSELALADNALSHKHFIERLGQLVDISGSITLAGALSQKAGKFDENAEVSVAALKEEYVALRMALVQFIIQSYTPGVAAARVRLPSLNEEVIGNVKALYEPYHRFYAAHQREFELKIQRFLSRVRDIATGQSPALAQLVALDRVLADNLLVHTRKFFAVTPRLLGKRFIHLYEQAVEQNADVANSLAHWLRPGGWLTQYHEEMKGVLLAELEVRLLPVLGLIEAIGAQPPHASEALS